jgi:transglutaminase-like putative cysteine protease
VGFVWNAQYGGLKFSGRPTTVLQVQSARPPTYLRAAVLDDFQVDTWVIGQARGADSLEPAAARQPRNQTREVVTVDALADQHLVGGSIPMRFVASGGAPLIQPEPGFAALNQNLPQGFRYTVWSYTKRPAPAALRRSPANYPLELETDGLLSVGNDITALPFGIPDRGPAMLALVSREPGLYEYLPLARIAERVAGGARTPYGAVEALQRWFLSTRFHYSNHPAVIKPALVGFVTKTHAGYCQYFAGAMTLMLRYLGIPARVAVGFAGGTYDPANHIWNISDREAHAWVEVWFKGYGWLPFDPTPAAPGSAPRQTLAGVPAAAEGGRGSGPFPGGAKRASKGASTFEQKLRSINGFGARPLPADAFPTPAAPPGGGAACRQELTSFLVDQRIEAPRSATLGELGELFRHEFGAGAEAFVVAATAARFGPSAGAADAAVAARRELRKLLAIARRSLTWRDRARGLLSLRSLTRPMSVDAAAAAGNSAA